MASVVPRVIPIFIRELTAASTRAVRDEHITSLINNLADVFNSRVLDDDVADLVCCLLSIAKAEVDELEALRKAATVNDRSAMSSEEANVLLTIVPETTSFHILRLLLHMFDLKAIHSARCFRSMKKFSENLTRKKAIVAGIQANNEMLSATASSPSSPLSAADHNGSQIRKSVVSIINDSRSAAAAAFQSAAPTSGGGVDAAITALGVDEVLAGHFALLHMDGLLENDSTRRMVIRLWKEWDGSGIAVDHFTAFPEKLHLYLPQRNSNKMRVFRDFAFCTPRPKLTKQWGSTAACHIKTNIPKKSDIMYRILVEGYNYGVNAVVFSDVVGYTNRNWESITDLEQYGWPVGWDSEMANDYAPGVAISQYYSGDGYLVIRLRAKSMFCIGFSVSGWMVFHGFGAGFPITGTISHQDEDL